MVLTKNSSQLGNMVVVHYILSQKNESYVHNDRLTIIGKCQSGSTDGQTAFLIHLCQTYMLFHYQGIVRRGTIYALCACCCGALMRLTGAAHAEQTCMAIPLLLHNTSSRYPAVYQHLSRRVRLLRAMFQERLILLSNFGHFPCCIDIKCRVHSRRLHF